MVACKVYLAVAVVFVAAVQIHGRPSTDTADWGSTFVDQFKNLTSQMSHVIGDNSEYATAAKNGLTSFADSMKAEIESLSKSFNANNKVSDTVKESTKQWQTQINQFVAELPKDINAKKFTDEAEQLLKSIMEQAADVTKKAQGNTDIETQVKESAKKTIDALMKTVNDVQSKFSEPTKKI